MEGSSHSYQRALHCLADLRTRREEIRAHWFLPYFITAAFRISSSVFFQTPPFIIILIFASTTDSNQTIQMLSETLLDLVLQPFLKIQSISILKNKFGFFEIKSQKTVFKTGFKPKH